MTASKPNRAYFRFTDETMGQIAYLVKAWSGMASRPTVTEVIEEAIRRAYESENKRGDKKP